MIFRVGGEFPPGNSCSRKSFEMRYFLNTQRGTHLKKKGQHFKAGQIKLREAAKGRFRFINLYTLFKN